MKFSPLVPLRYPQEKARAENESRYEDERSAGEGALRVVGGADPYRGKQEQAGVQICLLRWEKVAAEG